MNFKKVEHSRRLIDNFINKIVLWDDIRIYFGSNYKDFSKEMTFDELEEAGIFGSDISALGALKRESRISGFFLFVLFSIISHFSLFSENIQQ